MVFQQYFCYIVAVSFIGGGNWSTRKKHRSAASHWQTLLLYRAHLALAGFEFTPLVVIGTDCIGSCKSNYNTITTTMATGKGGYYA